MNKSNLQALRERVPFFRFLDFSVTVRIPTKPASDSDQSPATHSDFIPAGAPI